MEMKIPRRAALISLLLALCLFLGFLFRAFILAHFVTPVALVFWLLWRVIQSVDQKIYWSLLAFPPLMYALRRLTAKRFRQEPPEPPAANVALENVNYWRASILLARDEIEKPNFLKQNLGKMLATAYASRRPGAPNWEIYDALKLRQMPLPEHIHAFLFSAELTGAQRSFKQRLQGIWLAPQKWIRRQTGRDVAEYYQAIEEILTLMELAMETRHADESFDSHNH
jgi:hypothetical protein